MSQPTTTLARIKAAAPCASSWRRVLRKVGGLSKYGEDASITVRQIVEAMDLEDALWCLRTMPEHDARWRLLAVRYARRVQHLMKDPRSVAALDVAERHAHGTATDAELSVAGGAARAARDANDWADWAWAAEAVATAVMDAARDAYIIAAGCAARAAMHVAGGASAAAWAAEREWQTDELIRICEDGKS